MRSALSAWLAVCLDMGRGRDLQFNLLSPAKIQFTLWIRDKGWQHFRLQIGKTHGLNSSQSEICNLQ